MCVCTRKREGESVFRVGMVRVWIVPIGRCVIGRERIVGMGEMAQSGSAGAREWDWARGSTCVWFGSFFGRGPSGWAVFSGIDCPRRFGAEVAGGVQGCCACCSIS